MISTMMKIAATVRITMLTRIMALKAPIAVVHVLVILDVAMTVGQKRIPLEMFLLLLSGW